MNIDIFRVLHESGHATQTTSRLEYQGAIYHVMNRGDRREDIFLDGEDRKRFLVTLAEVCRKTERRDSERKQR